MLTVLRFLGYVWAFPLTVAGWLAAVVGGAYFDGERGEVSLWVARPGGVCALFFNRFGMAGYTWGACIVVAQADLLANERLIRHELAHVRQCYAWGPLMPIAYCVASLVALARGGRAYRDNAFEVAARAAE